MKAYYRTDKRGNVRWHALGKDDRPLCGVGPGEDDDVKDGCSPTDVDCFRCHALMAAPRRTEPVVLDLNTAMVVAPEAVVPAALEAVVPAALEVVSCS